jgi:hypothetical protein
VTARVRSVDARGRYRWFWPWLAMWSTWAVLAAAAPSMAAAHRGPAVVLSLLAWGEAGAQVLVLNEGLAFRAPDGWRYVCPALWGEDDITPAAALEAGPVVIGAASGLFLLDPSNGLVTAHPDPAAQGPVIWFAHGGGALFALRKRGDLTEVLRIAADRVEVLWSDPQTWLTIAADASELHVLGVEGDQLHHVRLSQQGVPLAREQASTPERFVGMSARVVRNELYVIASTQSGPELGQIVQGAWVSHCKGGGGLTGPVESEGELWVTIDSRLSKLEDRCAAIVPTPEPVSCVGDDAARSYACTKSGLHTLAGASLGDAIFELRQLGPPNLVGLAPEQCSSCESQWWRYRSDLFSLGVLDGATTATETGGGDSDACSVTSRAGAGGAPVSAGSDGAAGAAVSPAAPPTSSGCSAAGGVSDFAHNWLLLALVSLWSARHRGRRIRA